MTLFDRVDKDEKEIEQEYRVDEYYADDIYLTTLDKELV